MDAEKVKPSVFLLIGIRKGIRFMKPFVGRIRGDNQLTKVYWESDH